MAELLAIIDATYKGNFESLSLHRMPGALPFAGKFRLIDFTLSNIRNSKVTNVAIFPYGNYRSLQDHVGSGKRWDLDRRRDGLFILPPKNSYIMPGKMITFQRMGEHIEFLLRSTQEFAIIMPSSIVWNIDFKDVLNQHIQSRKDITEVMHQNDRLRTYVLSKKILIDLIESAESMQYRTMLDIVAYSPSLSVNIYHHESYTKLIESIDDFLTTNLDMLNFDIGRKIFKEDAQIFSKEKTAPPAKYLNNALVENSTVAAGSIVDGVLKRSIIGRDVVIKKNVTIKNSYIMSNCFIEEGAYLENVILDKRTVVKKDTYINSTPDFPYISQKRQVVTNFDQIKICMVASEAYPFIKRGGLADVIGGLSRNLVRLGVDVTVILPYYKRIKQDFSETIKREFSMVVTYDDKRYKTTVFSRLYKKVRFYFIESFDFFDTGQIYGYDNDPDRFAFFNKAVVTLFDQIDHFDLLHIHDWHTALLPLILDNSQHNNLKTLLTIHNVEYQGKADAKIIHKLGIKNFVFRSDKINILEIGIDTATKLSTVSPTYKEELTYEYYGKNLTYFIIKRERDFFGILNGISSVLNPERDKLIHTSYQLSTRDDKLANKNYLQEIMELQQGKDKFVIGMVSRIVEQKGFDLLISVLDEVLQDERIQFVLLGEGETSLKESLKAIMKQHPNQVRLNLGYDATVPNYIYAGADAFLMPSRFEPCGLGQMIALKYGTLPIVRDTGGLSDTVDNYDPITHNGNGFKFYNYDGFDLQQAIESAKDVFFDKPDVWDQMVVRAMQTNYSLKRQARKYIDLYR
ncbi:MAG: glycogen/starch synthase, partial [Candidatus Izimaplasma sp.]|nr:glycogen/starch synthase [Candidatus Izimaplasma bacterium]